MLTPHAWMIPVTAMLQPTIGNHVTLQFRQQASLARHPLARKGLPDPLESQVVCD